MAQIQILRDSDGIYKVYQDTITKSYVDANGNKWADSPNINVRTCMTLQEAIAGLPRGSTYTVVDGGYKESETLAPQVSDAEIKKYLPSIVSTLDSQDRMKDILQTNADLSSSKEAAASVASQQGAPVLGAIAGLLPALSQIMVPRKANDNMHTSYISACAKFSVANNKVKLGLAEYMRGYEDASSPETREILHDIKKGILND